MTTKTVGSGGDYATLAAWATYLAGRTYVDDEICEIIGEVTDTGVVDVVPGTPGAFNTYIRPFAGGAISGRLFPVYGGARARLSNTVQFNYCYYFNGAIFVQGLQLHRGHANGGALVFVNGGAIIERSILDGAVGAGDLVGGAGSGGTIRTSLLRANFGGYRGIRDGGSGVHSDRNTIVDCSVGFKGDFGTGRVKGTVVYNCTTAFEDSALSGSSHNATSAGSFTGTGFGTNGQVSVTSAEFVSVGSGTEDYTLVTGSTKLKNLGVAISGVTLDLFGASASQGSAPDIGAVEFTEAAPAPILTGPSGAATGPTQATIGVTSDTAPTVTAISYQILPAATADPSATTIVGAPTGTISTGSAGALTAPITGLTTNTAVKAHFAQGTTSNVQSSAAFTPNTLAISGTALSAQTGTAGAAFVWTGATPESLITNAGNGSGAWTAIAGVGASGVTVNSSTGILVAGSLGTAGSYTITLQRADGSTVPGAQTVTKTVGLTIGASGDVTAPTMSAASVIGGVLSAAGSITSNETGALWTKMDGNATAADPGAGNEAGTGWTSQSMLAASNAVSFGAQPAGLRYGHFLGVDAAGNRAAVVNASGTVTGVATYGFSCGPFAPNTGTGPVLNVPVSYTLNFGEVGAASGSPINGAGTIHASTGLLAVTGLAAAGLYSVQIKNADGSSRWHGTATAA